MKTFMLETLTVERRTFTKSESGEGQYTWTPHMYIKCNIQLRDAVPMEIGGKLKTLKRGTVYSAIEDVQEGDRIVYNGANYTVVNVYPISGSHQEIALMQEGL